MDKLEIEDDSIILDIGCGCGGSTEIIKEYASNSRVIGIDNNVERIDIATHNINAKASYIVGDARKLEFEDNSVDVCFARMLFEVCNSSDEVIEEMIRVTKRGGIIVVMSNLSTIPMLFPEPVFWGKYRLAEERLKQKARNSGLINAK